MPDDEIKKIEKIVSPAKKEKNRRAMLMTNKCRNALIHYMKKHNISLNTLAKRLHVSYQCVYAKMTMDVAWNFATLMTIADALDLEINIQLVEIFNPKRNYKLDEE